MDVVRSISIAQVSGIIALGTSIVAITIPLLIGIVLLRYTNRSTTAATWSVIARQLHSSKWPSVLRVDSAAFTNVERRVVIVGLLATFLSILNIVAGVVTPLGLFDEIAVLDTRNVDFQYVSDGSVFGRASGSRPDLPLSRSCTVVQGVNGTILPCPGVGTNGLSFINGNVSNGVNLNISTNNLATGIPNDVRNFFTREDSTVASIFDIQYRFWRRQKAKGVNNGEQFPVGLSRPVENLILRRNLTIVEGIIADMQNGGIGYRNHTAPSRLGLNSSWSEDILWIEPEVVCVDTNLSLKLIGAGSYSIAGTGVKEISLIDDGGFVELKPGNPYNLAFPEFSQSAPNMAQHLDHIAWLHNYLLAITLNLTDFSANTTLNVSLGQEIPLVEQQNFDSDGSVDLGMANALGLESLPPRPWADSFNPYSSLYNSFDWPPVREEEDGTYVSLIDRDAEGFTVITEESHPRLIAYDRMEKLDTLCGSPSRSTSLGDATRSPYNFQCDYLLTIPERLDGGLDIEAEEDSEWKTKINICGAAPKASVRTVSFSFDGGASIEGLRATSVSEKMYETEADVPLWAMEDWKSPGQEGAKAGALWGIVNGNLDGTAGYNFTRSPSFYLPSSGGGPIALIADDILAGIRAPRNTATDLWTVFDDTSDSIPTIDSYSGTRSVALHQLWEELGKTQEGIETMLKVIWTDIMASHTIGTRSRPVTGSDTSQTQGIVVTYARRLSYHFEYAVPAIILLTFWVLLFVRALLSLYLHRPMLQNMKELLNDTSVGRAAAALHSSSMDYGYAAETAVSPAQSNLHAPTSLWLSSVGHLRFRLSARNENDVRIMKPDYLRGKGLEENLNGQRNAK